MDNDDQTTIPEEVPAPTPAPSGPPMTTVEGFLYGLGSTVSNLRTKYRLSENASLKLVQFGLEYDLSRRHMRQEDTVGNEASNQ